jgi:hypothetical protein
MLRCLILLATRGPFSRIDLVVQDYINEKQMIVKYVNTNDMIADILTKPIQGEQFNRLRDLLLGTIPEKLYS